MDWSLEDDDECDWRLERADPILEGTLDLGARAMKAKSECVKKSHAHPYLDEQTYKPSGEVVMGSDFWKERLRLDQDRKGASRHTSSPFPGARQLSLLGIRRPSGTVTMMAKRKWTSCPLGHLEQLRKCSFVSRRVKRASTVLMEE